MLTPFVDTQTVGVMVPKILTLNMRVMGIVESSVSPLAPE
jgi:hypothetical protein